MGTADLRRGPRDREDLATFGYRRGLAAKSLAFGDLCVE